MTFSKIAALTRSCKVLLLRGAHRALTRWKRCGTNSFKRQPVLHALGSVDWGSEHMDGVEPCFGVGRPVGYWQAGGTQAISVGALREDVQLRGIFRFLQCLEIKQRILLMNRVVFGLD